jgi:hypothetical protein
MCCYRKRPRMSDHVVRSLASHTGVWDLELCFFCISMQNFCIALGAFRPNASRAPASGTSIGLLPRCWRTTPSTAATSRRRFALHRHCVGSDRQRSRCIDRTRTQRRGAGGPDDERETLLPRGWRYRSPSGILRKARLRSDRVRRMPRLVPGITAG